MSDGFLMGDPGGVSPEGPEISDGGVGLKSSLVAELEATSEGVGSLEVTELGDAGGSVKVLGGSAK